MADGHEPALGDPEQVRVLVANKLIECPGDYRGVLAPHEMASISQIMDCTSNTILVTLARRVPARCGGAVSSAIRGHGNCPRAGESGSCPAPVECQSHPACRNESPRRVAGGRLAYY
jgi:hypothetical protein